MCVGLDVLIVRVATDRISSPNEYALRSRSGAFICSGYDAEIYIPDALGSTYCPVRSNRKLSPEEVALLRAQRR